ncbi:unnamed protein product [Albugo candida]|uniref:Dihydrolipoamide acetyltransferase component of pyruvate dehydrogenase complex n=1 Tax=Albugo candida TaxID=65357 RepID=A0A024G4H6_9STRA|nr:unnamed protein product [Albugo candida]|eukprot:CCI41759.1 unnamed protein product [Albugo candida]
MFTKHARVIVPTIRCRSFTSYMNRKNFHQGNVRCVAIVPFKLADIGEGIAQVEILQWFVREGQRIQQFESVCQATVEITSRFDGIVRKIHYQVGESAHVGKALIDIELERGSVTTHSDDKECKKSEEEIPGGDKPTRMEKHFGKKRTDFNILETAPQILSDRSYIGCENKFLAAPSVRRLAKEHGVNLSELVATGTRGMITKEDLLKFIKSSAASLALKHYPMLNARVDECGTKMVLVAAHNISVAMDTTEGLVVPNIKNVQSKGIMEIADELNRLQKLSAEKKLTPSDFKNGTFTLSNIGSIGGTYMIPILLVPQVAIGAIGRIQTLPRFDEKGNIIPVRLMNVSWSGDHRVIDGATMCRFSNLWKMYLERPTSMLAEMS